MRAALRDLRGTSAGLKAVAWAWFRMNLAEWAYITALSIHGYRTHGALAVGLIGARFAPGAVLGALILAPLARRAPPPVLRTLSLVRCLAVAGVAVAVATDAPLPLIVAIVWLDAVVAAPYRPVQSALLPALAATPRELSSVAGSVPATKALAQALGALAGSLALLFVAPAAIAAGAAAIFAAVALGTGRLRAEPPVPLPAPEETEAEAPAMPLEPAGRSASGLAGTARARIIRLQARKNDIVTGFVTVARRATALLLLGGTRSFTRGLWTSLTVVASIDLLHFGGSGVGVLMAAAGVGAAIAMPLALRLAGQTSLAPVAAIAFAFAGLPITVIGLAPAPALAIALVAVWGVALSLADSISNALIHRVVDAAVLAPAVAALENSKLLLEGLGSLAAPALVAALGVRGALIVAGAPLPLLVLTARSGLSSVDRSAQIRARPLHALRRAPSFRGLTMLSLESLAARLQASTVAPGARIVTEGELGDRFYLIDSGRVEVTVEGYRVAVLGPGGSFGERALLRAAPRYATVTALEPTALWDLGAADFIAAATGDPSQPAGRAGEWGRFGAPSLVERLEVVPLFGAVDCRELAAQGRELDCPPGHAIVREGEPGDAFYVLLAGAAEVTIAGRRVNRLEAGDWFGEIALLHPVPRAATVSADGAARVFELPRERFRAALGDAVVGAPALTGLVV